MRLKHCFDTSKFLDVQQPKLTFTGSEDFSLLFKYTVTDCTQEEHLEAMI